MTTPTYKASPTSPPSPPTKWVRATQLINELDAAIQRYLNSSAVPDASAGQMGVRILDEPPESLSLLLGDALQNLHSALDHEVHRQVAAYKGSTWTGLEHCAFPTFDDARDYAAQRKRLIGGLRPQVQSAIDYFQTCDPNPEPAAAKLRLLSKLSRIDRHRLLHLTTLSLEDVVVKQRVAGQPDAESPLPPTQDDGAAYFDIRATLAVRFVDGPAADENIIHTLNDIALAVAATIEKLRVIELRPDQTAEG